ncbi:hypothetical protein HRM2_44430 [Desulforapulum autotrophicum HRM2]|uniref:Uncharacterized protein n=1 Tax=Desulforapulum autotrophicum (strain ATCC 43914 / DSM 3382 / VKM B-1955 / HRM2) TaxID=177437 RepID=C0QEZ8_DESAH|nr:hypothetical protein [Desulforapulum autotrophicum]ACN17499.1 hypothetical protein HRM2_44430 [Desulforapulum autotrophicum HRM2]
MDIKLYKINNKSELAQYYSLTHYKIEKEFFSFTPLCPDDFENALKIYNKFIPLIAGDIRDSSGELLGYKIWKKITDWHYHSMIEIIRKSQRRKGFSKKLSDSIKKNVAPKLEYLTKIVGVENILIECEPATFTPLHHSLSISKEELVLMENLNLQCDLRIIPEHFLTPGRDGFLKTYKII